MNLVRLCIENTLLLLCIWKELLLTIVLYHIFLLETIFFHINKFTLKKTCFLFVPMRTTLKTHRRRLSSIGKKSNYAANSKSDITVLEWQIERQTIYVSTVESALQRQNKIRRYFNFVFIIPRFICCLNILNAINEQHYGSWRWLFVRIKAARRNRSWRWWCRHTTCKYLLILHFFCFFFLSL